MRTAQNRIRQLASMRGALVCTETRQNGDWFHRAVAVSWALQLALVGTVAASERATIHFRCEKLNSTVGADSVAQSDVHPGRLLRGLSDHHDDEDCGADCESRTGATNSASDAGG